VSIILCPPPDDEPYPTLGPFVCRWIEEYLCFGPGDLLGRPVALTEEQRAWLYRMYEVEPPHLERRRGGVIVRDVNPRAGRRRFERCALSLRKGSSKTEFAAWVAAVELHHDSPVRCDGFEKNGRPIPRPVSDPYIPMIAYTEEQSEELAYGALRRILQEMPVGEDFDIGLERIMRRGGDGKAEAVSSSPNARDGARTTFQHADETHRFTLGGLKRTWTVMLANLAKRPLADPWALETTTAPEPGAGSVAEGTMEYARAVIAGRATNNRLFFFHREASEEHDLTTTTGLRKAIIEASGPYIAAWTDVDRIVNTFNAPDADRPYLERVWLNRLVQSSGRAFDSEQWAALARDTAVPGGSVIVLGFDGSRFDDATAVVATHVESGFQWPVGVWERPTHLPEWEVPVDEVDAAVADAFERYRVVRMYCDPPKWESYVAKWAGQYGEKRVVEWWTNRRKPMAYALRSFVGAMAAGEVTHDGNKQLAEHIANARRQMTGLVDEEGVPLWIMRKERPDSPKKIDAAMAAALSWEARNDAVAAGEGTAPEPSIHFLTW
jgi:phage terminase large subunit-like protein